MVNNFPSVIEDVNEIYHYFISILYTLLWLHLVTYEDKKYGTSFHKYMTSMYFLMKQRDNECVAYITVCSI